MNKLLALVGLLAAVGGVLLWQQTSKPTAGKSHKSSVQPPPEMVKVRKPIELPPRALPVRQIPDQNAASTYKQARLARLDEFNNWVRVVGVSSEQETKVLQILADAQAIYDAAHQVRNELQREASLMRDERMTAEQRQRLKEATARYMDAMRRQDDAELADAEKARSELLAKIDDALEATAPSNERAAFAAAEQIERDLAVQVMTAFAEFLTPRQIDAFSRVGDVFSLLEMSRIRFENEQYAKGHR